MHTRDRTLPVRRAAHTRCIAFGAPAHDNCCRWHHTWHCRIARRVQEATKFWGERAFIERFSYEFSKGERLGVVGPNGAGKSTLLDLLAGLSSPDEGERILGDTSVVGYFAQHPPPVNPKLRIIDYISSIVDTSCAPPPAFCTHHVLQVYCSKRG